MTMTCFPEVLAIQAQRRLGRAGVTMSANERLPHLYCDAVVPPGLSNVLT